MLNLPWILAFGLTLVANSASQDVFLGFTLVDAESNEDIQTLEDGGVIDIGKITNSLTVRANVVDDSILSRVVLNFDDGFMEVWESVSPYLLGGRENDVYNPVLGLLEKGQHVITAAAYGPDSLDPLDEYNVTFWTSDTSAASAPTASPVPVYDVRGYDGDGEIRGEMKKWHKLTLGFMVHTTAEYHPNNPFLNYRFDVNFTHTDSGKTYLIPGYFACDGDAANTGQWSGPYWLAHFTPDEVGEWTWYASFVEGENVSVEGGGNYSSFDGRGGAFDVKPTDKTGRDLRGKGRLEYVGEHFLRFAETGEYFLKAGADSPENLLAYEDFDDTPNYGGYRKTWQPHVVDYVEGDPTWMGGKGKGIIGAVNYLSNKGMNAFSFLTLSIGGEDKNVYPYDSENSRLSMDCSKLAQWEVVFEHADKMGLLLHLKTQESENDRLLDGGELGIERKLYYRELIARFGHHLALQWNIGEDNQNSFEQHLSFAEYFKANDPYQHPIVIHNSFQAELFDPLLGLDSYDGASLQSGTDSVYYGTRKWVRLSEAAGKKWIVTNDEQGPNGIGVAPDDIDPNHDEIRQEVLWGNLMAGGAGAEYYFGYKAPNSDLTLEDFRSRSNIWDQSRHAINFFQDNVPFWNMLPCNRFITEGDAWCLRTVTANSFVIYTKERPVSINLLRSPGSKFQIDWVDPRNGGELQTGTITSVMSSASSSIGFPTNNTMDWVALLTCIDCFQETDFRWK